MVVIFSRTRRAMFGEAFRYLELLHTTSENFSRVTFIKVFHWKNTLSYTFVRIFWELDTLKNSFFSVLFAYFLIYASYDRHFFLKTRSAMFGETFRSVELLHTTLEKFSRVTFTKVFNWKKTLSYTFVRICWELNTLKNSIFSLWVAYLLIYASYDRHCFADA